MRRYEDEIAGGIYLAFLIAAMALVHLWVPVPR